MTTHAGRPRAGGEGAPLMKTIAISLSPTDAEILARLGDGNRSAGVRKLLSMAGEMSLALAVPDEVYDWQDMDQNPWLLTRAELDRVTGA